MLPTAARLHAAADFAAAVRRGRRGSSRTVVVHWLSTGRPSGARAGFVVSKKVGNSVIRHRVTRRLRPLVRERLAGLPAGSDLVVRALPAAAVANSRDLARNLDTALGRVLPARAAGSSGDSMFHSVSGAGADIVTAAAGAAGAGAASDRHRVAAPEADR